MKKAIIIAAAFMMGSAITAFATNEVAQAPQASKDCAGMTPAEQLFATQLNATNKSTFCGKFTSAQRQRAMSLRGQPDATGAAMTDDGAVQKVVQENAKAPSGGCPVK
jgi:hypothetical protein